MYIYTSFRVLVMEREQTQQQQTPAARTPLPLADWTVMVKPIVRRRSSAFLWAEGGPQSRRALPVAWTCAPQRGTEGRRERERGKGGRSGCAREVACVRVPSIDPVVR